MLFGSLKQQHACQRDYYPLRHFRTKSDTQFIKKDAAGINCRYRLHFSFEQTSHRISM